MTKPLDRITGLTKVGLGAFTALACSGVSALATQPQPWEYNLQPAATEVMQDVHAFSNFTMFIVTPIMVLVMLLMLICVIRFNAKSNPVPSRTTHHTLIEVLWTVVPVLILVIIAVPSFRLLYKQLVVPPAEMTIKATGYQWYWGYEYADDDMADISFDSFLLSEDERAEKKQEANLTDADMPRLLSVDNDLIVPVHKIVRVQVTAADVIHSFAMPSFGIKVDAVPGRLNETWFKADRTGVFYGQCSELCGKDHAFMPIVIRVVTQDQFDAWATAAKTDIDAAYKQLSASITKDGKLAHSAGARRDAEHKVAVR